jgi:lipopolysaccharide/colanic/teichoic acid biosynthesis glycosyltransferase
MDFQEWIRFDIEYVEKANWRLDLLIILKTFRVVLGV